MIFKFLSRLFNPKSFIKYDGIEILKLTHAWNSVFEISDKNWIIFVPFRWQGSRNYVEWNDRIPSLSFHFHDVLFHYFHNEFHYRDQKWNWWMTGIEPRCWMVSSSLMSRFSWYLRKKRQNLVRKDRKTGKKLSRAVLPVVHGSNPRQRAVRRVNETIINLGVGIWHRGILDKLFFQLFTK